MPIKNMTPDEILVATAEQIAAGASSTARSSRLPGETSSEANARITQGYKELLARPILTPELEAANAEVKFVRQGAGGVGEYVVVTPIGTKIPADDATQWSVGIIPSNAKYVTGTTLGMFSQGDGTVTNIGQVPVTTLTKSGEASTRSFEGQDAYYTAKVGTTGLTQAQLDAAQNARRVAETIGGRVDPVTGRVTGGTGITSPTSASTPAPSSTPTAGATSRSFVSSPNVSGTTTASPAVSAAQAERQSAYDLLLQQFNQYGLGALVEPLKGLITSGASPAEFTIRLRESDAYKKRFAANQARIQKGLTAISEAEYLGLEDQYQNIMRNFGLPESYYARGEMGTQEGFNKFIANDVSAAELEDRISTAQRRVINANPEVLASLREFYPDISNADILAYTLDPAKGLESIKRKVTAAEIGGAATQAGLKTGLTRAEELAAAGITKQQAQQGFQTVAEVAPRGGQLAEIYKQSPYTQQTAEAEVFGLAGSAEAARQRKKLTSLETAAFSGSAGAGAIARDRAGVL